MLVIVFLLLVLGVVLVVGVRHRRRQVRDDTARVGDTGAVDGHEAARRAGGRNAWLRGDF